MEQMGQTRPSDQIGHILQLEHIEHMGAHRTHGKHRRKGAHITNGSHRTKETNTTNRTHRTNK